MSTSSNRPDLAAIARESEVEILTAEAIESELRTEDSGVALSTAELGYYEAELGSLRDAAETLADAEHRSCSD